MKREDGDRLAKELLDGNPVLIGKISKALESEPDLVPRALAEVVRFLALVAEHAGDPSSTGSARRMLTPSHRVDLVWHELILFTRLYDQFCKTHFGRFLHHTPGGTDEDNHRQFRETQRAYRDAFGEPDAYFWGDSPPSLDDFGCGSCEGS